MHKQSMIFGVGIGICIAVAVLFVVYIIQRQSYASRISELNERVYQLENALLQAYEDAEDAPAPTAPTTTVPDDDPTTEPPDEQPAEAYEPYEPQDTTPAQTTAAATSGYVHVHIPANIGASDIALILFAHGVVTDFDRFMDFLVGNGFTVSLMAGDFTLPLDGNYDVIMRNILAGGR